MRGNPRRKEYFRWFELAVERDIRLTRVFEYYMETLDISYHRELPKSLLMYFNYNNSNLGDMRKAYIYADVIANKTQDPQTYQSYQDTIRSFAAQKIREASPYQGMVINDEDILIQDGIIQLHSGFRRFMLAEISFGFLFGERFHIGNAERKGGTFPQSRCEFEGTMHLFGELFADGKSEPSSFDITVMILNLDVWRHQFSDVFLGYPAASIRYGKSECAFFVVGSSDRDGTFDGEFHGISDQVEEDLADPLRIQFEERHFIDFLLKLNGKSACCRFKR